MSTQISGARALADFRQRLAPSLLVARPAWVAFSGGLDSTVLLKTCIDAGLPVRAIHVNHHLQPAAGSMQTHCEQWCSRHLVPLDVLHVTVDTKGGESLEAQAREARYAAICEHVRARSSGDALVLTAHHRDDQIETILIALFRGSGMEGLAGMPDLSALPVPNAADIWLGRPFLGLSRAVLQQEAESSGLTWFDDPTNADIRLRRNWLRNEGLPAIREQFPQIEASVLRLSRQVAEAREEWTQRTQVLLQNCTDTEGRLSRTAWSALTQTEQVRVLRQWLTRAGIRLNEARSLELRDQLLRPQGGLRRVAPDWGVRIRSDWMQIETAPEGDD